nr:retrovirus-related Pol polyprotein from transposon TNT 1-94 [Tanacetum cinerariifolium]
DLDEFCGMKGIKREYSNARTPQQNRVAERKNRTYIEAAKTMLADSLFPITFWVEAVNTVCYVLNRALVTKTHNKTSYELLNGRTPRLDFMRPFGCPVTILNTQDPLGKFEGKVDEGFLVGYFVTSKAFRTVEEPVNKEDQAYRDELDRLMSQENEASDAACALRKEFDQGCMDQRGVTKAGSTNSFNTVSYPVHAASTLRTFSAGGSSSSHLDAFILANTLLHTYSPLQFKMWVQRLTLTTWNLPLLQEEGIDYDEVFAPVARIEAIRIFLAFASYIGFIFNQMDIKSSFLYGTIEERVYVCQPSGFIDPQFLNKVSKVEKAYKVKQSEDGIFMSQDKYVAEILKNFDFSFVKTASTPIETQKPLVKDEEVADVDVHLYRSMIGSLMYLTASRPDIMFAVCACSRFQVTPKLLHLHDMKRIFRYLKGQPKLGLWYPRDSPFNLEAYSDSDYAGANLDRKSTTGEYVAANCCGQVCGFKIRCWIMVSTS